MKSERLEPRAEGHIIDKTGPSTPGCPVPFIIGYLCLR